MWPLPATDDVEFHAVARLERSKAFRAKRVPMDIDIFFVGWKGFQYMRTAPPDAMVVRVTARQWSWTFDYENGKASDVLRVPVRKPVKLSITSADVLHSLSIPAYRIKEDAVPGMQTHLWFLPDEIGSYDLFCTEYCGVAHSSMITKVVVMSQQDFEAWYSAGKTNGLAHEGAALVREKGCVACHTIDGTPKVGPTFKGLYGRKVTAITSGEERVITADESYIIRSIKDPTADVVKGFQPVMPAVQLTDGEIEAVVAYIKTLK